MTSELLAFSAAHCQNTPLGGRLRLNRGKPQNEERPAVW